MTLTTPTQVPNIIYPAHEAEDVGLNPEITWDEIWDTDVNGVAFFLESDEGVIAGVVVLGLGTLIAAIAKPTYCVKITSASGEAKATPSKDKQYIDSIVMALNEALIRRG